MQDRRDTLAVIGAGPVGLAMAKALKAHGTPHDQLEADDDAGGNWYHDVYTIAPLVNPAAALWQPQRATPPLAWPNSEMQVF